MALSSATPKHPRSADHGCLGGIPQRYPPPPFPAPAATSCAPIFGYTATPGADHDTLPATPLSLADAAARCSQGLTCRSFNSARQLKAAVSPSQPQTVELPVAKGKEGERVGNRPGGHACTGVKVHSVW